MSERDPLLYLNEIVESCNKISRYIQSLDEGKFFKMNYTRTRLSATWKLSARLRQNFPTNYAYSTLMFLGSR